MLETNETFGELIKRKRDENGMNLRDLAAAIKVSAAYISFIERGKAGPPSEEKIIKLAGVLNIDSDELLSRALKTPKDLRIIISQYPKEIGAFLRMTAGIFSKENWQQLKETWQQFLLQEIRIDIPDHDLVYIKHPALFKRISDVEISVRLSNVLKSEGIDLVGDIASREEIDFKRMPNVGKRLMRELREILTQHNLSFGMEFPGWEKRRYEGYPILDEKKEENISTNTQDNRLSIFRRISDEAISVRLMKMLKYEGMIFLGDIACREEIDFICMPNIGKISMNELREILKKYGLSFGMDIPNWAERREETTDA